jgi:hypothetical protein
MSLFYLYRFKFAVKLQIILFENAIIVISKPGSGQFWPCCWEIYYAFYSFACASSTPSQNHLVPVFSCEKALNIKKIIKIEGLGLGYIGNIYGSKLYNLDKEINFCISATNFEVIR